MYSSHRIVFIMYLVVIHDSTVLPDEQIFYVNSTIKYFQYTGNESKLNENDLSLFVDYSTCITLGQHSPFFQSLVPSFVAAYKTLLLL